MKQGITYPCRIIRHETPEHSHRCRDKHRIYLDNRLYLRLDAHLCRRLLPVRAKPSRHTSNRQQRNQYPRQPFHNSFHPFSTSSITAGMPFSTNEMAAAKAHTVALSSMSGI